MDNSDLLVVQELKKAFPLGGGGFLRKPTVFVKALDGIDLVVKRGETLAVVGESGCGKTTLGRCILRLDEPTDGRVYFENHDVLACDRKTLRRLRRDMQIIFQDPYSSLNHRMTIGRIICEGLTIHGFLSSRKREERVKEIMEVVGLRPEYFNRYPHEFSGGQRQRICIARALVLNPKLIIADEPVSALDVSIQAQILNLMVNLQKQFGLTYLFISHDLSVVRHFSDRVAVMYLGRIVEIGKRSVIYDHSSHPYTYALISAAPVANPLDKRDRTLLGGDVPSPIHTPPGCSFHPRCDYCQDVCAQFSPSMKEIEPGHWVSCHFPITTWE